MMGGPNAKLSESSCALLLGLAGFAALAFYLQQPINHDTAWYLAATPRLLDGARLYRDIIEINPPLAFYLTMPPILAARITDLSADACFTTYVFLLGAASLTLANHLLARLPDASRTYRWGMLFAAFVAFAIMPMPFFGQREHLTLILAMPYLLLVAVRVTGGSCGGRTAVLIGALAAAGLGLKPYFLIVPVLLEAYGMIVRRSLRFAFRPETWALGTAIALYVASIFLLTPDYVDFIVPMASLVYGAYSAPLNAVIGSMPLLAFIVAILLYAVARAIRPADRPTDILALAAVGFTAAYLMQSKGWLYQLIPAIAAVWLMGASILLRNGVPNRGNAPLHVGVAILVYLLIASQTILPYRNSLADDLLPVVHKQAAGGAISALTSYVWVGFPLVNEAHVGWASRFPGLWQLPGAVSQLRQPDSQNPGTRQKLLEIERYTVDAVVEDFQKAMPDLVIVDDDSPYFGPDGFDFLAYFNQDPRFARLWQAYVRIGEASIDVGGDRRFEIWCRRYAGHDCAG